MTTGRNAQTHVGAILMGGVSRRFGGPKPLARIGDLTILDRVLVAHAGIFRRTILVTAAEAESESVESLGARTPRHEHYPMPLAEIVGDGAEVVRDAIPGAGPIGGLHAALTWARAQGAAGACVSAGDTPFIETALLRSLVGASQNYDAVIPLTPSGERLQPLFAWYSSGIIEHVEEAIRAGRLSLHHLIRSLQRVKILPVDEIPLRRPAALVFLNVNTPGDLAEARRALEEYPDES